MAHNFYAVKRGFDKKQNKEITDLIAEDWYEVAPLVKGYSDARYKGFDTKEEAETWLAVVDKVDAEKRSKGKIEKLNKEIKKGVATPLDDEYLAMQADIENAIRKYVVARHEAGISTRDMMNHILHICTETSTRVVAEVFNVK